MKRDKKEFSIENDSNSEDDSSSSEEDENAELWTEELEEGFFKVLSRLKKKDSKLYEESVRYFPNNSLETDTEFKDLRTEKKDKKSLEEYRDWLRGQKEKIGNKEVKKELEALHDFWTSPTLNKDEQFLRDYILNKKFLEADDSFNIDEAIKNLSDEEREVEEQMLYEHKFNCRFESPGQKQVVRKESKSKMKNNKACKEISVNGNDDDNSLVRRAIPTGNLDETLIGGKGGSNEEEAKKKKRKKRNKKLNNRLLKESEESKKVENTENEKGENSTEAPDQSLKNNENVPQANTIQATGNKKSRKRKRNNSERKNVEKTASIMSCDQNKTDVVHSKKKKKNFQNLGGKSMEHIRSNLSPKNKQKPMNSLPRNLKMKNEKGAKKIRHRHQRKKLQAIMNNRGAEQDVKVKDLKAGLKVIKGEKKKFINNNINQHVSGVKKQNNFQKKKDKHFHNSIVKEKKNKEFKFGKMLSKKQKAAIAREKNS